MLLGAMSGSILAVVTWADLGHAERLLSLPTGAVWIYVAINIAALSRVVLLGEFYSQMQWLQQCAGA